MQPAGIAAFEKRSPDRSGVYSYEQRPQRLEQPYLDEFRAHERAWAFFTSQAPSYQRAVSYWVMSAKRDETRRRRFSTLVEASAAGRRIAQLA